MLAQVAFNLLIAAVVAAASDWISINSMTGGPFEAAAVVIAAREWFEAEIAPAGVRSRTCSLNFGLGFPAS